MTINLSAYNTAVCESFAIHKVVSEIERDHVGGQNHRAVYTGRQDHPLDLYLLEGGSSFADAVPFFHHPVLIDNPRRDTHDQAFAFCVDVRDFGKWNALQQGFEVRNKIEYAWQLRRAVLNQLWVDGRVETFRDISPLPQIAYASLVSQCVAKRFALDPAEQMTVTVLAAYFYACLFTNETVFEDTEKSFLSGQIATMTRVPVEKVLSLLDSTPCLHGLASLCEAIKEHVDNVALQNFNLGTLLAVISGNWYGSNGRELVGVSLEHVPTWLSIVASSLKSQVYKRTALAKIVQNHDKANLGRNFTDALEVLLGGPTGMLTSPGGPVDPVYAAFFSA